jgi:phospholipase C
MSGLDDRPRNEEEERQAAEEPESFLKRREFLAKTAALAGVAGLATVLPVDRLLSLAAEEQTRAAFPSPRNMPLDNIVVLMMENRSFDHYFGDFAGADGRNKGLSYPDAKGRMHPTHYLRNDFQGCGFKDPDHSFEGGREQYHRGKLDGFYKTSDAFALGYYKLKDLGFLAPAARAFTTYDRYFCSILASTYPNRHYMISAQSGGQKNNELPTDSLGNQWETIFDRAKARGVSFGYYVVDLPVPALYGDRGLSWIRPIEQFYADAAAGTLPQIAYVDPPFLNGGGGDGLSGDEHPHGDIRMGQAYMSEVAHAFMESPQWKRGAMFINYDEWGGFFDHVKPRMVPDDRARRKLSESFGITGFRIPNAVLSPYAKRGHVSHATVTHESILKLISYRFGLGYLNKRHRYASQIGRTLDFENPDREVPDLPSPLPVLPLACSAQGLERSEEDEAEELEKEGPNLGAIGEYAERVLGYEVKPATPERVFRNPGRTPEGLAEAWRSVQE